MAFYTKKDVPPADVWEQLNQTALPRLWLPRKDQIFFVDAIPTLGSGKVDLKGLKDLALSVQATAAALPSRPPQPVDAP